MTTTKTPPLSLNRPGKEGSTQGCALEEQAPFYVLPCEGAGENQTEKKKHNIVSSSHTWWKQGPKRQGLNRSTMYMPKWAACNEQCMYLISNNYIIFKASLTGIIISISEITKLSFQKVKVSKVTQLKRGSTRTWNYEYVEVQSSCF